jgi:eukaryotic-like serine/threonine-protein kinase
MDKKDVEMLEKTVDGKYTLIGLEEKGDTFQSHLAHYHLLGTQVMVDLIYPARLVGGAASLAARLDPLPTLRHPSISRVFAWGEEDDYVFVVRESVHGSLLSELLQESGGLPPGQALEMVRRLVEGLGALYGRGIFYTGLNPHQVWLDRKGEVSVIRPGYSFLLEREDRRFSREAAPYWAPEVISGGEGTRASDIFSLGMMVRRLLVSWKEDAALTQVLRDASAHDPARRPASARVFLERMEQALSSPAPGGPASGPARLPNRPSDAPVAFAAPAPPGREDSPPSPLERLLELARSGSIEAAEAPPRRGKGTRRPLKLALAGSAAALALILALYLSNPSSRAPERAAAPQAALAEETAPEPQLVMPDLRGMDQAEARRLLQEMGLEVETVSEPSNVVPAGKVIIQEPLKGESMRRGCKVKVYVSTGPLERQAAGLAAPAPVQIFTSRGLPPGRGGAIRELRGPGGPAGLEAACPGNRGHEA